MSQFLTHLNATIGKKLEKGKHRAVVTLQRNFCYSSDMLGYVRVPTGFVSDGASVPQALWSIYPPFGKYLEAAVIHDYYCVLGNKGESPIDSVTAAKLFREVMQVCGVSKWRRTKMYWAVRIGGPKFDAVPE